MIEKIEKKEHLKRETKKRVAKMENEFIKPPFIKLFGNEGYDQIIAQVGIPITALCEHHEVAFNGECHIAYIPHQYLI